MEPGQSGRERASKAVQNADALEAQARELLRGAEQARQAAERISRGNEGEQVIGGLLEQLVPDGWRVLHDRRRQPGSPANLDHVLVGPPGVFVIDAKNWTGGRLRFDDRGMALAKWRKDDELHSAKVDADIVRGHVDALTAAARTVGVLAFLHDMGLPGPVQHRQVVLLQREQLLPWLRALPTLLGAEQVTGLGVALDAALPPRLTQRPAHQPHARPPTVLPVAEPPPTTSRRQSPAATPAPTLAAAPARPQAAVDRRKERARHKARRELKAVAVKLAILAVCLPAAPWVIEHVVSAASPYLIHHLVPPTPTPTPASPTPPRPPGR